MIGCRCKPLKIQGELTGQREWNPACPFHGIHTDWYRSAEQMARREAERQALRDLQAKAAAARKAVSA